MAEGQQPPFDQQQQLEQHQQPAPLEPGGPTEMLDQRVVVYWLVSGVASLIVPLGLLLGGTAWVSARWSDHAAMTITARLAYARWRFSVNDELLLARYGIIWIEEKSIPISRLQHVDVLRGPIERLFGLATLVVFTAGTEGAHFRLPGLAVARARQLRDQILAARGDDVI
ncbi:MAG: PH domain-containing protein [Planctomycetota bacterium]|jgi:membrane protein YdbS with pleckstrin-like domain